MNPLHPLVFFALITALQIGPALADTPEAVSGKVSLDPDANGNRYARDARDARAMRPMAKFIFNTGDMGYATPEGADKMFRTIGGHINAFPLPMFVPPGNHDLVGEPKNYDAQ